MKRSNATLLAGLLALSPTAYALPEGGNVQSGQVNTQVLPGMMNLQQLTDRAIINWNSFSIGSNELLRVLQPNQAAILLNRVVGQDPSVILGQLQANGNIWLLNPNGILFGPGSRVDVGGLLATTLNISDHDFLAGRYNFSQLSNKPLAAVINQGELTVSPQGYVILSAPLVSNEGMIVANLGKVGLISGESMSLSFDSQGLISYRLTTAQTPTPGPVLMTPDQVSHVMRSVVQAGGVAEGNLITQQDGRILLTNASGTTINTGQVVAPGASVTLDSTTQTVLRNGSLISVNGADYHPDAGDIRVLSQGATWAQSGSRLEASSSHGNGGFVEVSGNAIAVASQVDVAGATPAQSGDFLIDPAILNVTTAPGDLDGVNPIGPANNPGGSSTVSVGYLQSVPTGTIHLEADQDLFVDANVSLQSGVGLNLTATSGNVTFNSPSILVETVNAPMNITAGDSITLGSVRANGNTVTLTAPNGIAGGVQNSTVVVNAGTTGTVDLDAAVVNQFTAQAGGVNLTNNDNLVVSVNATNGFNYNGVGDITGAVNASSVAVNTSNFIGLSTETSTISRLIGNNAVVNNTGAVGVGDLGLANDLEINNAGNLTFLDPNLRNIGNQATINVTGDILLNPAETSLNVTNTAVLQATGNIDYGPGQPSFGFPEVSATSVALSAGGSLVAMGYDPNNTRNLAINVGTGNIFLDSNGSLNITTIGGIVGAQTANGDINGYLGSGSAQLTLDAPVNTTNGNIDLLSFGNITVNAPVTASGDIVLFGDTISLGAPLTATNTVEINANNPNGDIVQVGSGVRIQADTALLFAPGSIGSQAAPLSTDVRVLAAGATNDNYIQDGVDANVHANLDLAPIFTGEGFALGVRGSSVALNAVGNLTARDITGLNSTVNATGDIFIDSVGTDGAGINGPKNSFLTLTAGGNLTGNGSMIAVPDIAVDTDLNVTAGGEVDLSTSSQNLRLQTPGNVSVFHTTDANVTGVNSTSGSVDLQVNGILTLSAASSAANDYTMTSLDQFNFSGGNITAGGTAVVGSFIGNLTTLGGGVDVSATNVALSADSILGITVQASNLAAGANSDVFINALGAVTVADLGARTGISGIITSGSNIQLQSSGALTVAAAILPFTPPGNVSLIADSGDLTVNSLVDGNQVSLTATDGNVRLNSPGVVTGNNLATITANGTVPGNGNIIGSGAGPQVEGGSVSLNAQDSITGVVVNGIDGSPVFLDFNAGNSAQLGTVANTILSSSTAGNNMLLDVTGNLDLGSPLNAAGTVALNVTGSLADNYGGPGNLITASALGLRVAGQYFPNTAPLSVNVTQLAIAVNNPGVLNVQTDVTPVTVTAVNGVSGITVPNGLNLTTQGPLTVNSPITAGSVGLNNITVQTGDLTLNAPVGAGNESVRIQVPNGNIAVNGLGIDASTTTVTTGGNLSGSGAAPNVRADNLSLSATAGSVNLTVANAITPITNLSVSALDNITISSANELHTDNAVATNGNLDLNVNGSFRVVNNPLIGGSRVTINATGDVDNQAASFATTPALGINATTLSGGALTTSVNVLAVRTTDDVAVSNSAPNLTVGNVNGISGLSGTNVSLDTSGNLSLTAPVSSSNDTVITAGGEISVGNTINSVGAANVSALGNLTVAGNIAAGGTGNFSSGGDLTVASEINVGGLANMTAGGALTFTTGNVTSGVRALLTADNISGVGTNHHVVAPEVALRGNNIGSIYLTHPAGFNNTTLAAASNTSATIVVSDFAVVGTVDGLDGINAADNVSLGTTYASIDVNRPINADNVSLAASQVNVTNVVTANSTVNIASILGVGLSSGSVVSPNLIIGAQDDITGTGLGPHALSNNVSLTTNSGDVNVTLAPAGAPSIDLALNSGANAYLTATNSVTLAASQASNNLTLGVTGNLTLTGTVNAGNVIAANVNGNLINSGIAPNFQAAALGLRVNDIVGGPITTNVSNLAVQSLGSVNISQAATALTIAGVNGTGVNATGPVNLTALGPLTVNAPVNGLTVNVSVGSGDLTLNAPLQSASAVNAQVSAGNAVLSSNSIMSPNAAVNASGNINGVGAAPHIVSGNVSLNAGNINAVGLARAVPGTISLGFNAVNAAQISAANSVALNGASSVGTDLELAVTGNLTLSNNIVAGNNISVNVTGDLANSGVVPSFQGNALSLRAGNVTGAPITTNVSLLAAQSSGSLSIDQTAVATPLTISAVNGVTGVNASGAVNLNGQGTLTVNAPVSGSDVNLGVASGNLDVNALVQGTNSVNTQVNAGDVNLNTVAIQAPNAAINASGNINGLGLGPQVFSNNVSLNGNDLNSLRLAALSAAPINLAFNAATGAQISANGSVNLNGASSVGTDLELAATGNLILSSNLVAGGTVALNVTGDLANPAGTPSVQANALALRVGNVTGAPVTLNVTQLAAQSGGDLNLAQVTATPLTVTAVNGVTGLSSPGAVNLTAQGPLTFASGANGADINVDVANGDLNVNAPLVGTNSAALQVTSGNANLSGLAVSAPTTSVNASGNVIGLGANPNLQANSLTANSATGAVNISAAALTTGSLNLNAAAQTDLNLLGLSNVTLASATSNTGDVNLNVNGDLTRAGTVTAVNQASINVTGVIDNPAAGLLAQANGLVLRSAGTSGLPLNTNVTLLAAQSSGTLRLNNNDSLIVSNLSGVNGVNASDIDLNVSGNLTVANPLSATNNASVNASNDLTVQASGGVTAGNQAQLRAGGNLSGTGPGPHATASSLGLTASNIGPFTVSTPLLAANATNNLTLQATGGLTVGTVGAQVGLSATNVSLTSPGALNVAAPVNGNSVSLVGAGLGVTGPVTATGSATLQATAGDVNLSGTALLAPNASISATGSVTGSGLPPQIVSNNLTLDAQSGNVTGLTLAAGTAAPINLGVNAGFDANLTANNSVVLSGNPQAGNNLTLSINGDLTLNNTVVAGNTVAADVTGTIVNAGGAPDFVATALALRANDFSGGPLVTNVSLLAAQSGGNLSISQAATPLTLTPVNGTGIATVGTFNLDTQGPLTVNGQVLASSSNIAVQSGDFNVNAPIQTAVNSAVVVQNGNLNLQGSSFISPSLAASASGNVTGNGAGPHVETNQLNVVSTNGSTSLSVNALNLPQTSVQVSSAGNTSVSAGNNVLLLGLQGTAGNVNLNVSGDVSRAGTVQAGATATINATGNLNNTLASTFAQAQNLVLQAGSVSGQPLVTNVTTLSAQTGSGLSINQGDNPLTVNGITAGGPLQLNTNGALSVTGPISAASVAFDVATGNLNINGLVNGGTSVIAQVDNGAVNLNNLAITSPNAGINATGNITGSGFGPHIVSNNISLSSQNGGLNTLTVGSPNTNPITLALSAAGNADVTAVNGIVLAPPAVNGTLGLTIQGDLTLPNVLTASSLALSVTGNLNASGNPVDIQAGQLQLTVGGNVGSSAAPLQLSGPTQIAGNVTQSAFIESDSTLTVTTVNGTNGLSAGSLDIAVTSGNLSLQQGLNATGNVNLTAPTGSISGPGVIGANNAVLQADGPINVNTSVNGLAAVSATNSVTVNESNGLAPIALSGVTGVNGTTVNITLAAGDLNLIDPSLGNNSAIVATQQVDLTLLNGNVLGSSNPAVRADVTAPQVNFAANGSVGAAGAPIRIGTVDGVNASNPNFIERFPAPPAPPVPVPPPVLIEEPGQPPTVAVFVDSTSLGLTVGSSIPVVLLQPAEGNDSPGEGGGLWQVQLSWAPAGATTPTEVQPFQRSYLLDMSLEQLMNQPMTSGYILMTLEQLLNEPLLSPFLEKTLEELLNVDINVDTGDAKQD